MRQIPKTPNRNPIRPKLYLSRKLGPLNPKPQKAVNPEAQSLNPGTPKADSLAEYQWDTKPMSSDEDIADEYEASYAETEEEVKSSVSAPKSGVAVSEDLAHSHASSDHAT